MTQTSGTPAMVEYALGYTKHGWRVFPLHTVRDGLCTCGHADCSSAGKHPRTKNGVKDATTDRAQIQRWWQQWPEANIGIATGNGLYVIDIDYHKGGQFESLHACNLDELLCSRTAQTGSGGSHLYLSYDPALWLPNTANKLGPFIDTRGEGGYVVAPPSRNSHGMYRWENVRELLPMPPALLARLLPANQAQHHPSPATTQLQAKEETHHALSHEAQTGAAHATASPTNVSPAAAPCSAAQSSVAKEARNDHLMRMAGKLRANNLSLEDIRWILLGYNERRYGDGKHPKGPLAVEEIERTILKSLAKYEAEQGTRAATLPVILPLSVLFTGEIPDILWVVPELLSEGLTVLAGKPKAGKSWFVLDLALTCALGSAQRGRKVLGRYAVEPASVLYLSLEEHPAILRARLEQLLGETPRPENFHFSQHWKPLQAGGLADLDHELLVRSDTRLVVIDTLAKVRQACAHSGSVYQEDYQLLGALQELAGRHHVALLLVHHTRKLESADPFDEISGSTGITGAADISLVLKRPRNQPNGSLHLTGRTIAEQELALVFHAPSGLWTCTGSAAEQQVSHSKQEILDLLDDNEAMSPKEVAEALEKPSAIINTLLSRMAKEGLLVKSGRGRYALPSLDKTLFDQMGEQAAD